MSPLVASEMPSRAACRCQTGRRSSRDREDGCCGRSGSGLCGQPSSVCLVGELSRASSVPRSAGPSSAWSRPSGAAACSGTQVRGRRPRRRTEARCGCRRRTSSAMTAPPRQVTARACRRWSPRRSPWPRRPTSRRPARSRPTLPWAMIATTTFGQLAHQRLGRGEAASASARRRRAASSCPRRPPPAPAGREARTLARRGPGHPSISSAGAQPEAAPTSSFSTSRRPPGRLAASRGPPPPSSPDPRLPFAQS